ncbi:type 4a pilus biogenesis protein PilO [Caldibacillus lycopersici]|uniref:Type 4a pilus biogenesis protein PilO n=1 Tax=Perspicuibacillus lycopersici TaxID=1325689 RepID=A0AAE3ISX6_9BACI|nr:type 4a pilus biogenesis protein PilO [Perspicuibacillus lycopersici]MCU9614018.1 type 4a pilus biogenesis protein PilO [Perspicuibacillus lycopersici]
MTNFIEEKKKLVILILVIMFLLIGLFYVNKVMPIKKEAAHARRDLETIEEDIDILETQMKTEDEEQADNDFQLERKMPTSRKLDDVLLSLKKIETDSSSQITTMSFIENSELLENELSLSDVENGTTNVTETTDVGNESQANIQNSLQQLKLITINLSVTSPSFGQFQQFLQGIEQMERITKVDNVTFTTNSNENNPKNQQISTNIQITTFYFDSSQ